MLLKDLNRFGRGKGEGGEKNITIITGQRGWVDCLLGKKKKRGKLHQFSINTARNEESKQKTLFYPFKKGTSSSQSIHKEERER